MDELKHYTRISTWWFVSTAENHVITPASVSSFMTVIIMLVGDTFTVLYPVMETRKLLFRMIEPDGTAIHHIVYRYQLCVIAVCGRDLELNTHTRYVLHDEPRHDIRANLERGSSCVAGQDLCVSAITRYQTRKFG